MLGDFLYAARTLRSGPAFAAAAVFTLALGIGAGTAVFSVVDSVLLRPLPYSNPDRLIYACTDLLKRNVYDYQWSTADLLDLRATAASTIEDAAGVSTFRAVLQHRDGQPEEIAQAGVTTNLFRVLGAAGGSRPRFHRWRRPASTYPPRRPARAGRPATSGLRHYPL